MKRLCMGLVVSLIMMQGSLIAQESNHFSVVKRVDDVRYVRVREVCERIGATSIEWVPDYGGGLVSIKHGEHSVTMISECYTMYIDGVMFEDKYSHLPSVWEDGYMYMDLADVDNIFGENN